MLGNGERKKKQPRGVNELRADEASGCSLTVSLMFKMGQVIKPEEHARIQRNTGYHPGTTT